MKPILALVRRPEPESEPEPEAEILIVAQVSKMRWTRTSVVLDPQSTAMAEVSIVNQHSITDCLTMTLTSTATPTTPPESPSTTAIDP